MELKESGCEWILCFLLVGIYWRFMTWDELLEIWIGFEIGYKYATIM